MKRFVNDNARDEVARRNLSCRSFLNGVKAQPASDSSFSLKAPRVTVSDAFVCMNAVVGNPARWDSDKSRYVQEARRRGITCGLETSTPSQSESSSTVSSSNFSKLSDVKFCNGFLYNSKMGALSEAQINEQKRRGIECEKTIESYDSALVFFKV